MRIIIIILVSAVILINSKFSIAQTQDPATMDFRAIGKIIDGKATVKIIPGNQAAWFYGMHLGYTVSISEYKDDFFTPFNTIVQNLKPAPETDFLNPDLPPKYAEVMKKIIYEQNFNPPSQSFKDLTDASENMSRHYFGYVLFSTYHPLLSELSGLQFQLPNDISDRFILKIEVPGSEFTHEQIMTKSVLYTELESPDIDIKPGDETVKVSWNHKDHENHFSAYILERSVDGYIFDQIGIPHVHNSASPTGEMGLISVTDSIPSNYTTFSYRLRGYDAFGYLSTPRTAKPIFGRDLTPPEAPQRVQVTQITEKEIHVSWSAESIPDLAGFQVIASDSEKGTYHRMHEELLPPSRNSFDFTFQQEPLRFYRVLAVDTASNASASDLGYLVLYDTIPPQTPTNISAIADTNRMVSISWTPSPDKDLKGYRVYKAFHPSHGFIPITPVPITEPFYVDTLGDKRLEKKVYYQIVALDQHFNHSKPSTSVVADIPDIHPPTSPLLTQAELDKNNAVQLSWKGSSSTDVESYEIMRRLDKDTAYTKIGNVNAKVFAYSDENFSEILVNFAEYHITAIDSSGNISEASNGKRVLSRTEKKSSKIEIISAAAKDDHVVISWDASAKSEFDVLVYRAENDEKFQLLDRVSGGNIYSDKSVRAGVKYQYKIGLLGSDGYRSPLSNHVDVELK